jgi:hypothetical protein
MLKPLGLVLEMLLNERNLIPCAWIFRDDPLHASGLSHLEDVDGL